MQRQSQEPEAPTPTDRSSPGEPNSLDLLTIALLVFFVSLIGIVAGLLVLPALGA